MNLLLKLFFSLALLAVASETLQSQSLEGKQRSLAVLDMMDRNDEDDSRLFSCEQTAIASGVPFTITDDVFEAIQYGAVLLSSDLFSSSFSTSERDAFINYVNNGGILISSNIRNSDFYPVFGISEFHTSRDNWTINWQVDKDDTLFEYFNDPMEIETSLGRESRYDEGIWSRHYDLAGAEALAYFNDDPSRPAFTRNKFGNGYAYAFGFSIREVILRPMLTQDYQAQRVWSNGFEPSADVFVLLLRSIFSKHIPHAVWKHTSPANSINTVMITHDLDSRTAMDTMMPFAVAEKERGIEANYNQTVRYFNDEVMSDFYIGNENKLEQVKEMGHVIASHSVGHFLDFAEFELGSTGMTMDTYQPYYDGNSTSNGYVMPEVEISKKTLENNHDVDVKLWRSGHLAFPKKLVNALEQWGYIFDSSHSSNNVLYSFPFQLKKDQNYGGEVSDVLEISMTISDVWEDHEFNGSNYENVVENNWIDATERYADNYSPVTLLVHPNRNWKLKAQNMYVDALPRLTKFTSNDDYGYYWKEREALEFYSEVVGKDSVVITVMNSSLPLDPRLSFGVFGSSTHQNVTVQDENGNVIMMQTEEVSGKDHVLVFDPDEIVGVKNGVKKAYEPAVRVYPNPVRTGEELRLDLKKGEQYDYQIIDMNGRNVQQGRLVTSSREGSLRIGDHPGGVYILRLSAGNNEVKTVKVLIEN